jgi:hypothetical protein
LAVESVGAVGFATTVSLETSVTEPPSPPQAEIRTNETSEAVTTRRMKSE